MFININFLFLNYYSNALSNCENTPFNNLKNLDVTSNTTYDFSGNDFLLFYIILKCKCELPTVIRDTFPFNFNNKNIISFSKSELFEYFTPLADGDFNQVFDARISDILNKTLKIFTISNLESSNIPKCVVHTSLIEFYYTYIIDDIETDDKPNSISFIVFNDLFFDLLQKIFSDKYLEDIFEYDDLTIYIYFLILLKTPNTELTFNAIICLVIAREMITVDMISNSFYDLKTLGVISDYSINNVSKKVIYTF